VGLQPDWTRWRREKSHDCHRQESNPDRPARSLVYVMTEPNI